MFKAGTGRGRWIWREGGMGGGWVEYWAGVLCGRGCSGTVWFFVGGRSHSLSSAGLPSLP